MYPREEELGVEFEDLEEFDEDVLADGVFDTDLCGFEAWRGRF